MNAPIDHATNASMFMESRTSAESPVDARPALVSNAMSSTTEPVVALDLDGPAGTFRSMKIKAELMGRIGSVWV